MAMCGKKLAAMPPKQRPDLLTVGLWQRQRHDLFRCEKRKPAFRTRCWQSLEPFFDLEQKHQPMALPLVAVFTYNASQVQICWRDFQAKLFLGLTARAGIRRFANVHLQLTARGAPETAVRLVRALEQQHLVPLIETIEQCRNLVW